MNSSADHIKTPVLDSERKQALPRSLQQLLVILILLTLVLSACGNKAAASTSIGILFNDTDTSVGIEQQKGYDAGSKAAQTFTFVPLDETAPQSDVQRAFRDLVQDPQAPMLALLGGTSNSGTSHVAALANFFNVPMIVPTADGDNLFPSNNLWAFRLSAPGTEYARYLFGRILTKQDVDEMVTPSDTAFSTELRVAILYEQNTFGESAAVATAEAVMAQSIRIRVYANFKPENTDPATVEALAKQVKEADAQLVYLISSDPALAKKLVQTFRAAFDDYSMPILVGQAGGFATQDFLDSKEAEGIYVLRQQIDRAHCPDEIQSSYSAQAYAAIALLNWAVQRADEKTVAVPKRFSLSPQADSALQAKREAIRDALKETDWNVPCLGRVAFDNTGQNKNLKLEIIHIAADGTLTVTSPADFLDALKERLANFVIE